MLELGQDLSPCLGDKHGMLQAQSPLPLKIDSWLDGNHHARLQGGVVVRNDPGFFMEGKSDAVPAMVRIRTAERFHALPQEGVKIAGPHSRPHSIYRLVESGFDSLKNSSLLCAVLSHRTRVACISPVTFVAWHDIRHD